MSDSELAKAIEVLKDRLYYVVLRAHPMERHDCHLFTIDDELSYWPFFLDYGPLSMGNLYRFCQIMSSKLGDRSLAGKRLYLYSGPHMHRRHNAVYLLAAYSLLYLGRSPEESWRPFAHITPALAPWHDASPTVDTFHLTTLDVLRGLAKARECRFFSFDHFDVDEYEHYEKVENGDLNWIVEGRFLAFAGPHDTRTSSPEGYHTTAVDDLIPYFKAKGVAAVVRLNKKYYNEKRFTAAGIEHFDMYYLDGSNPPDHILQRFLQVTESVNGAVAVHCKAGLGRTGTCIGAYVMKHYGFTAREVIGWMRVCRPGTVIGPQQQFLEEIQHQMWEEGEQFRKARELPLPVADSLLAQWQAHTARQAARQQAAAQKQAQLQQQQQQQQQQQHHQAMSGVVPAASPITRPSGKSSTRSRFASESAASSRTASSTAATTPASAGGGGTPGSGGRTSSARGAVTSTSASGGGGDNVKTRAASASVAAGSGSPEAAEYHLQANGSVATLQLSTSATGGSSNGRDGSPSPSGSPSGSRRIGVSSFTSWMTFGRSSNSNSSRAVGGGSSGSGEEGGVSGGTPPDNRKASASSSSSVTPRTAAALAASANGGGGVGAATTPLSGSASSSSYATRSRLLVGSGVATSTSNSLGAAAHHASTPHALNSFGSEATSTSDGVYTPGSGGRSGTYGGYPSSGAGATPVVLSHSRSGGGGTSNGTPPGSSTSAGGGGGGGGGGGVITPSQGDLLRSAKSRASPHTRDRDGSVSGAGSPSGGGFGLRTAGTSSLGIGIGGGGGGSSRMVSYASSSLASPIDPKMASAGATATTAAAAGSPTRYTLRHGAR